MSESVDTFLQTMSAMLTICSSADATPLDHEILAGLRSANLYSIPAALYQNLYTRAVAGPQEARERAARTAFVQPLPFESVFVSYGGGGVALSERQMTHVRAFPHRGELRLIGHLFSFRDGLTDVLELLADDGDTCTVARVCQGSAWMTPIDPAECAALTMLASILMLPDAAAGRRRMSNPDARSLRLLGDRHRVDCGGRRPYYELGIELLHGEAGQRVIARHTKRPPRPPTHAYDVRGSMRLVMLRGMSPMLRRRRRWLERRGYHLVERGQLDDDWAEEFVARDRDVPVRADGEWIACVVRPVRGCRKGEGEYIPAERTLRIRSPRLLVAR